MAIVFQVILILLIILVFVSFSLLVRRMSITQIKKAEYNTKVEKKLEKIIGLLEEEKSNR